MGPYPDLTVRHIRHGRAHPPNPSSVAATIGAVGSSGQKPRKPNQRHLPKVGSKANVDYEVAQKRQEVFRGWPLVLVAALLVIVLVAFLIIT